MSMAIDKPSQGSDLLCFIFPQIRSAFIVIARLEIEELTYPASTAVTLLQGKWRVHILCAMRGGPVRLGQLSRRLPEASKKVLMTELKQLVSSGLVERRDLSHSSVVRHVEYNLIESIRPATFLLLEQLEQWARVLEQFKGSPAPNENLLNTSQTRSARKDHSQVNGTGVLSKLG